MQEPGYARVNQTRLFYEVAGRGYPPVLVYGFALDNRMSVDQVGALTRHNRVIRYDLRGCQIF